MADRFEVASWRIDVDDETGMHRWIGGGAGDKERTVMDEGEALVMNPEHFPPGTVIECTELDDRRTREFYRKLLEQPAEAPFG